MKRTVRGSTLELVQGDITRQSVDAIVNAANSSLLGGGGVDGAIHRAGGPSILEECRTLNGCPTGQAKITTGGNLPANYVIHAVGPVYSSEENPAELLASCYRNSLSIARERQLKSIAFPSISTGAYGYPLDEAAKIALNTVIEFLNHDDSIETVRFVLFDEHSLASYQKALEAI